MGETSSSESIMPSSSLVLMFLFWKWTKIMATGLHSLRSCRFLDIKWRIIVGNLDLANAKLQARWILWCSWWFQYVAPFYLLELFWNVVFLLCNSWRRILFVGFMMNLRERWLKLVIFRHEMMFFFTFGGENVVASAQSEFCLKERILKEKVQHVKLGGAYMWSSMLFELVRMNGKKLRILQIS